MKIGAMASSIRLPLSEAAAKFQDMQLSGIQLFATSELLAYSDKELSEAKKICADAGLEITAVCGDMSAPRFGVTSEMFERVDIVKKIIDITRKLDSRIVTTHIGVVPEDVSDPVFQNMAQSIGACAEYAAKNGAFFAIETGPESAETLLKLIKTIDSDGLKVNFDPANLRMVSCIDPVHAVEVLAEYIIHTHAKDGINLTPGSPAARYKMYHADGSLRDIKEPAPVFKEVPLGEGQVPWGDYLDALRKIGYAGSLTIEREQGDTREKDIRHAANFLRERI